MTPERVSVIYQNLMKYEIALDPDPQLRGPKYLQGIIAECRKYLNAVAQITLEVNQEKQALSRDLRAREVAFQASFDYMLANDERVRRLPNIEDRKSTCRIFLRDDIQGIELVKAQIDDLGFVEKAIRHRHRELVSTMTEIKTQKGLIQIEVDTGAMYGDERTGSDESSAPRGRGPVGMSVEDVTEDFLSALFEEETSKLVAGTPEEAPAVEERVPSDPAPAAPAVEAAPAPEASEEPTEDDVAQFLGAVHEPPGEVSVTSEDFDNLLANI